MSQEQRRPSALLNTLRRLICRLLGCEQPPAPPRDQRASFLPGQIVILAEYDPAHAPSRRDIVAFARERLAQHPIDRPERIILSPERVTILPGIERTRATIVGEMPELRRDPSALLNYIHRLHITIRKEPLVGVPPKDGQVGQTGEYSTKDSASGDQTQAGAPAPAQPPPAPPTSADAIGFELRAASPNWLAGGAKDIIGGGPGAWPAEASGVTSNTTGPQPWEFTLPQDLQPPETPNQAIQVAILDTAPSMVQLLYAYEAWVGDGQAQPPTLAPNPLLATLLSGPAAGPFNVLDQTSTPEVVGPPNQLDVIYAPNLPLTSIEDHQYSMASHGLFIAGIIQSIAPNAKLRLIQVLNDGGGGSLESVAYGFSQALLLAPTSPIVFNCSFMLHVPRPGDVGPPEDVANADPQVLSDLTQALNDIFAHANQWPNVAIVAAAGNDGGALGTHPKARFPAAFEHVTGVAALAASAAAGTSPALTSYSDQADDQADDDAAHDEPTEADHVAPAEWLVLVVVIAHHPTHFRRSRVRGISRQNGRNGADPKPRRYHSRTPRRCAARAVATRRSS